MLIRGKHLAKPKLFNLGHKRFPLQVILIVPFVVPIIVSTALVGWFSFRNSHRSVNDLASLLSGEASARVKDHLNGYLSTPYKINELNTYAIEQGILSLTDLETMGRRFWQQMRVFDVGYNNFATPQGDF